MTLNTSIMTINSLSISLGISYSVAARLVAALENIMQLQFEGIGSSKQIPISYLAVFKKAQEQKEEGQYSSWRAALEAALVEVGVQRIVTEPKALLDYAVAARLALLAVHRSVLSGPPERAEMPDNIELWRRLYWRLSPLLAAQLDLTTESTADEDQFMRAALLEILQLLPEILPLGPLLRDQMGNWALTTDAAHDDMARRYADWRAHMPIRLESVNNLPPDVSVPDETPSPAEGELDEVLTPMWIKSLHALDWDRLRQRYEVGESTTAEYTVIVVAWHTEMIYTSGLPYYYASDNAQTPESFARMLDAMGATEMAGLLRAANKSLPGGSPAANPATRIQQLQALDAVGRDQLSHYTAALRHAANSQTFTAAIEAYITRHAETLGVIALQPQSPDNALNAVPVSPEGGPDRSVTAQKG